MKLYNCKRNLQKQRTIYEPEVTVEVGPQRPWFQSIWIHRPFMTEPISRHFRSYITTPWRTLLRSAKLNVGAAIIVKGTLVPTPEGKAAV